jgi:putative Holliday junction resolvase
MRYLGVDLGRARIGLALADDVLRTARPLRVVSRRAATADLAEISGAAREYEVDRAVLGLPLNMDGTEGSSARLARAFAPKLEAALGVPVELFDERLSTFEAETRLRDRGLSVKDARARVDAEAAAVILQGWLDREAP